MIGTNYWLGAMNMTSDDVAKLVSKSQAGDREAFGQLVERFAGQVTAVAYAVLGDFGKSEDVGQDAFLEAWAKLVQLGDASKFVSWVCTIARRRAIDVTRKRSEAPFGVAGDYAIDQADSAADAFSGDRERELMWNMVESLPETYRETMMLYYRSEQSVEQVASALDATSSTIRQRLKRGRDLLRDEALGRLAKQLKTSAPSAAFTAAILAGISQGTAAVAATGATSVAVLKATTTASGGVATKSVLGAAGVGAGLGAVAGPLVGLAGGGLGAYASWKNASYQSQRHFIVRQTGVYFLALLVVASIAGVLYAGTSAGWIPRSANPILWVSLLISFQIWNGLWILRIIRGDRRIVDAAQQNNEPLLPGAPSDAREVGSVSSAADGSWSTSGWFGGLIGGSLWMMVAAILLIVNQSLLAAGLILSCFIVSNVGGTLIWQARSRYSYPAALKLLCCVLGCTTLVSFLTIEFSASHAAKYSLQWSPAVWLILLIFPVLYYRFARVKPASLTTDEQS